MAVPVPVQEVAKMLSFLQGIADFFTSIFTFLKQLIQGFIELVTLIPQGTAFVTSSITVMPTSITIFATAAISICIVFLIIGRGT